MELTKDEQKLFFALCKYIRHLQNYKRIKKITDGVLLNSMELVTSLRVLYKEMHFTLPWRCKKTHAVAYSLQVKGYVKVSKSYGYKGKYISLDKKGIEYIQYLRKK